MQTDLEFELTWGRLPNRFESAVLPERELLPPAGDSFIPWLPDTRFYRKQVKRMRRGRQTR